MAKYYTKSKAKNAMLSMKNKAQKLYMDNYITLKDLEAIEKIVYVRYRKI